MGLGKKCDDRASGRLDCDLTSEGGEGDIVHVREKGEEREWIERNEGGRGKNDRKSDALKGY